MRNNQLSVRARLVDVNPSWDPPSPYHLQGSCAQRNSVALPPGEILKIGRDLATKPYGKDKVALGLPNSMFQGFSISSFVAFSLPLYPYSKVLWF